MKHYPNPNDLHDKISRINLALKALARLGIEPKQIVINDNQTLIEVHHCPGNRRLRGIEDIGRGSDEQLNYHNKAATLGGCRITWREYP